MEIEVKYMISQLPDQLEQYQSYQIEQGYLCSSPVVRIRKRNDDYFLTYKSRDGIAQEKGIIQSQEVEVPLTRDAYEHLRKKTDGILITKTRYIIPYLGKKIELDIFEGKYKGLKLAEIEFDSLEEYSDFQMPEWFYKNVSDDHRFSNMIMSKGTDDYSDVLG